MMIIHRGRRKDGLKQRDNPPNWDPIMLHNEKFDVEGASLQC